MAPPSSTRLSAESPELEEPRKRRRTAIACEECRERKRKCDGVRPVCGSCRRGVSRRCIWNEDKNSKGWWSNTYVEGLKARIKELESTADQAVPVPSLGASPSYAYRGVPPSAGEGADGLQTPPSASVEPQTVTSFECPGDRPPNRNVIPAPYNGHDSVLNERGPVPADPEALGVSTSLPHQTNLSAVMYMTQDESTGEDDSEAEVDAMGVVGSLDGLTSRRPRKNSGYFGPSSSLNLIGKARSSVCRRCRNNNINGGINFSGQILDRGISDPCPTCQEDAASVDVISQSSAQEPKPRRFHFKHGMNAIPPRTEADSLLESYWTQVHCIYPFIHRQSFEERYSALWNPANNTIGDSHVANAGFYATVGDELFYCMLNSVFSLGALFSTHIQAQNRDKVSRSFFDRTRKFLNVGLLDRGSIPLVQTLLLTAQYLQSTYMSSLCWNIVGLAIRAAQCIGLHHESVNSKNRRMNQLQLEMHRRTWSGCVLFDRVLSLTYGRPLMIHPGTRAKPSPLPAAIDDEFLTREMDSPGHQPEAFPSEVECYIEALKLQHILGRVLASFYASSPDDSEDSTDSAAYKAPNRNGRRTQISQTFKTADLPLLLKVDRQLAKWRFNLPDHLKIESYNTGELTNGSKMKLFRRQARILEIRHLHIRLILLRPVLSELCDLASSSTTIDAMHQGYQESSLRHEMLVRAANLCVSVAQGIASLITEISPSASDYLPAPWYNVFYIHAAAIVLLVSRLCIPKYINSVDENALNRSWDQCLSFLDGYGAESRSARRCHRLLKLVEQEIRNGMLGEGEAAASFSSQDNSIFDLGEFGRTRLWDAAIGHQSAALDESFQFSENSAPWMGSSTDMAWLSFVPFTEGLGSFDEPGGLVG